MKNLNAFQRGQGFDATLPHFYEVPMHDPDYLEVWCYTDALSYEAGDTVNFHLSTTAEVLSLVIYRDGAECVEVHRQEAIEGGYHATPEDFYSQGCGWPVGYYWSLPENISSGFYLVQCTVKDEKGNSQQHEAGFFVRPELGQPNASILLVAATSTWIAYNDWGGTSSYAGHCDGYLDGKSPLLSIHRPWAKGFLSLPPNAPRKPHDYKVRAGDIPRYPPIEFAYTRGYSKYYACAGWATYEKPFCQWLEQQGFSVDYATQTDLHYRPELLDHYSCVLTVGHDEYWSREMRLAMDRYIENGGNFARFGGNFAWQIRFEDSGKQQVCYKDSAWTHDPVRDTEDKHLVTTVWEDPALHWPSAQTVGVNALQGIYANVGHLAPRQGGGFTVYRYDHWSLTGTQLCYGDQFGNEANIFGYEVDGLDYEIRNGYPQPTYKDGALSGTEIIAMGLAANYEASHPIKGSVRYYVEPIGSNLEALALCRYQDGSEASQQAAEAGSGMMVSCKRGQGELFCVGSCEWVAGLILHNAETEMITKNVLNRFTNYQCD